MARQLPFENDNGEWPSGAPGIDFCLMCQGPMEFDGGRAVGICNECHGRFVNGEIAGMVNGD